MGFYFLSNKKAIISEYLPWLLIGLAVLVLVMITIYFVGGKLFNLDLKGLFRG